MYGRFLIPLPLSVVIWSGYVMFDMFYFYAEFSNLYGTLGFIAIPLFSLMTLAIWNGWFLEDSK